MYRYELHMHTKEGSACAVSSVEDMIKQYVKIGFSGAVVTNHFIRGNTCVSRSLPWEQLIMQYSKAYTNGRKIAEELDFDLFFGIEEGYGNGKEFLAYGFEPEFLLSRPFLRNADLNIWAQEIHSVVGACIPVVGGHIVIHHQDNLLSAASLSGPEGIGIAVIYILLLKFIRPLFLELLEVLHLVPLQS